MNSNNLSGFRQKLAMAIMKSGGCATPFCTNPDCCSEMSILMHAFGITYAKYGEDTYSSQIYELDVDLYKSFIEFDLLHQMRGTFDVLDLFRQHKSWELENPLTGWMEVPPMVFEVLQSNNWENRFREFVASGNSSKERIGLEQAFVLSFLDAIFPDELLDAVISKTGLTPSQYDDVFTTSYWYGNDFITSKQSKINGSQLSGIEGYRNLG